MLTPPLPLDQDPQNHRFLLVCETLIHSRQKGLLRKLFGKLKGTLCALAEPVLLDCNGAGEGLPLFSFFLGATFLPSLLFPWKGTLFSGAVQELDLTCHPCVRRQVLRARSSSC